jgi:hypothetical protein
MRHDPQTFTATVQNVVSRDLVTPAWKMLKTASYNVSPNSLHVITCHSDAIALRYGIVLKDKQNSKHDTTQDFLTTSELVPPSGTNVAIMLCGLTVRISNLGSVKGGKKSKRIPSIFKDESTGSCICLWKLAVAVANLRFIVNNYAKYFAARQQCKLYFHGNTLCTVDRLRLHQQQ